MRISKNYWMHGYLQSIYNKTYNFYNQNYYSLSISFPVPYFTKYIGANFDVFALNLKKYILLS